jgi:transcription elongation factor Elf1
VLCDPCHEKRVEKRIAEFDGDTDYTDEVICPHCGYEHSDSFEMSEGVRECSDCGREFEMERDVAVTYSTTKRHNAEVQRTAAEDG